MPGPRRFATLAALALATVACDGGSDAAETPSTTQPVAATTGNTTMPADAPATTASPPATLPPSTAAPTTSSPATTVPEPAAPSTVASVPAAVAGLPPLPAQPDGVPFPTDTWPEADLPADVDAEGLLGLVDDGFADSRPFGELHAVVAISGGELVLERYGNGWDRDRVHASWSVAKSVTHGLLGVLVAAERLDVSAPADIPAWSSPGDPRAAITPDMLARMSSGLEWNESVDAVRLVGSAADINVAGVQIERDLAADVDTFFNYSTGSTAVNGRVIGDLVGTGDDFRAWADDVLFDPLGITSVEPIYDGDDYWVAGYGADMTARDFARFGLLYLRDGVWDGARILPEGWVDDARSPTPTSPAYGSGFWLGLHGEGTFSAEGFLGQKVVIVPDADLVVVVLANNFESEPTQRFTAAVVEYLRNP